MSEFKVKGEIFNLLTLETNVVAARDLLESRKSLIRTRVLSIISNPSNSNYIFDADLHTALTDETVTFDHVFDAYEVQPNFSFQQVTIPPYVPSTTSTVTISSTVTLQIPVDPSTIDFTAVATKTSNTIENTSFNNLTEDDKTVLRESYKEAYIQSIAADTGIDRSVLDNSVIEIILAPDGQGGVSVNFKITNVEGASQSVLDQIQQSIVTVNSSGALSTNVTSEIQRVTQERQAALSGFSTSNIPATVVVSPNTMTTNVIANTMFSRLSPEEISVIQDAYKQSYIDTIIADIGIDRTTLENASFTVEVIDDGSGGLFVNFQINSIPGVSQAVVDNVQQSINDVNVSGELSTTVTAKIQELTTQRSVPLTNIDLTGIPASGAPSVGFSSTNTITGTDINTLTESEKIIFKNSYKQAYIDSIIADTGIARSILENATIEIELVDNGSGGIEVKLKVISVPDASVSVLNQIEQSVIDVNSNGTLAATVTTKIQETTASNQTVMVGVDLSGIPATSEAFIALAKLDPSGFEVELGSLQSLLNKRVEDMSEAEKFVFKEAYADVYIAKAAEQGVVLSRDNLIITLISGSIKVVIRVADIDAADTTFASQVESFFETTATEEGAATPEEISNKAVEILTTIIMDPQGPYINSVPLAVLGELDPNNQTVANDPTSIYNILKTFFASPEFVDAVRTSTVENVTLIVSADGEVEAFVIPVGRGVNKQFMINRDASTFTEKRRRDAIKKGKVNNSTGDFEKLSIAVQVRRQALRKVRSSGYRAHAKKFTKCC